MNVRNLIAEFSTTTRFPVDPTDVAEKIRSYGIQDEIEFIGVDLDPQLLRGQFRCHVRRDGVYADPVFCAEIYYDRNQPSSWKRFVCCKELLHMLDQARRQTSRREDVERLVRNMAAGIGKSTKEAKGIQALTDWVAICYALAILFPYNIRDLLMPAFDANKITCQRIAEALDIPLPFVEIVMKDALWPSIHDLITGPD